MPDRNDGRPASAAHVAACSLERRRICGWLLVPAVQLVVPSAAWGAVARIASARLWPAQEYTRVIVEAPTAIAHEAIMRRDPNRVVLELRGAELSAELAQLPLRVQASDPYIAAIRFGTR